LALERDRRVRPPAGQPKSGLTGFTRDEAKLAVAEQEERAEQDRTVHATARAIAARLAIAPPHARRLSRRSAGDLVTAHDRGGGADDIDLDRTLDVLAEQRPLTSEDILVRERRRRLRAVVLAVDVSGSMRGERLHTAAATVGALSAELARDDFAVIAFWSDAAMLLRLGEHATLEDLVDQMLSLSAIGLTNVGFPLEVAEGELSRRVNSEQRVLLLSDCVHNAGPDPRTIAQRLPRLDVLFDTSGEHDNELAHDLARGGRGLLLPVRGHRDVAPALTRILRQSD
jgi:Mg-chelatase subunit ChlD